MREEREEGRKEGRERKRKKRMGREKDDTHNFTLALTQHSEFLGR
jgi:hypothetical protein